MAQRPSLQIAEVLTQQEKDHLLAAFPEIDIEFTGSSFNGHALLAAIRRCSQHLVCHQHRGKKIIDLGGNVIYYLHKTDISVHCCVPDLFVGDSARGINRMAVVESVLASLKTESGRSSREKQHVLDRCTDVYTVYRTEEKNTPFICTNTCQNCFVKGDVLVAIDAVYDVKVEDFLVAMIRHGCSIGSVCFMPPIGVALGASSGRIMETKTSYEVVGMSVATDPDWHGHANNPSVGKFGQIWNTLTGKKPDGSKLSADSSFDNAVRSGEKSTKVFHRDVLYTLPDTNTYTHTAVYDWMMIANEFVFFHGRKRYAVKVDKRQVRLGYFDYTITIGESKAVTPIPICCLPPSNMVHVVCPVLSYANGKHHLTRVMIDVTPKNWVMLLATAGSKTATTADGIIAMDKFTISLQSRVIISNSVVKTSMEYTSDELLALPVAALMVANQSMHERSSVCNETVKFTDDNILKRLYSILRGHPNKTEIRAIGEWASKKNTPLSRKLAVEVYTDGVPIKLIPYVPTGQKSDDETDELLRLRSESQKISMALTLDDINPERSDAIVENGTLRDVPGAIYYATGTNMVRFSGLSFKKNDGCNCTLVFRNVKKITSGRGVINQLVNRGQTYPDGFIVTTNVSQVGVEALLKTLCTCDAGVETGINDSGCVTASQSTTSVCSSPPPSYADLLVDFSVGSFIVVGTTFGDFVFRDVPREENRFSASVRLRSHAGVDIPGFCRTPARPPIFAWFKDKPQRLDDKVIRSIEEYITITAIAYNDVLETIATPARNALDAKIIEKHLDVVEKITGQAARDLGLRWVIENDKLIDIDAAEPTRTYKVVEAIKPFFQALTILAVSQLSLSDYTVKPICFVDGGPGCGKSNMLKKLLPGMRNVIVATATTSVLGGFRNISGVKKDDVRTIDGHLFSSYVKKKIEVMFVDEALTVHAGHVHLLSARMNPDKIVVTGDKCQISYICRNSMEPVAQDLDFDLVVPLVVSRRIPSIAVHALRAAYPKMVTTNPRQGQFRVVPVSSMNDVMSKIHTKTSVMTYMNATLHQFRQFLPSSGKSKYVVEADTIHVMQGQTFDHATIVRTETGVNAIHNNTDRIGPHNIVALSRSVCDTEYLTVKDDDTLSSMMRNARHDPSLIVTEEQCAKITGDAFSAVLAFLKDKGASDSPQTQPLVVFFNKESPLSNMHYSTLTYNGVAFHSSEQAYCHAKCVFHRDFDTAKKVIAESNSYQCKKITKHIDSPPWKSRRKKVMEDILRCKFYPGAVVSKFLVATSTFYLAEASLDSFWGIGVDIRECLEKRPSFNGFNYLGKLLMKVRNELKNFVTLDGSQTEIPPGKTYLLLSDDTRDDSGLSWQRKYFGGGTQVNESVPRSLSVITDYNPRDPMDMPHVHLTPIDTPLRDVAATKARCFCQTCDSHLDSSDFTVPVRLSNTDYTRTGTTWIVNPTCSSGQPAGGANEFIFRAGGPALVDAVKPPRNLAPSEYFVTKGFDMPAAHVLHILPPRVNPGQGCSDVVLSQLTSTYEKIGDVTQCSSVSMVLMGVGLFNIPMEVSLCRYLALLSSHSMTSFVLHETNKKRYAQIQSLLNDWRIPVDTTPILPYNKEPVYRAEVSRRPVESFTEEEYQMLEDEISAMESQLSAKSLPFVPKGALQSATTEVKVVASSTSDATIPKVPSDCSLRHDSTQTDVNTTYVEVARAVERLVGPGFDMLANRIDRLAQVLGSNSRDLNHLAGVVDTLISRFDECDGETTVGAPSVANLLDFDSGDDEVQTRRGLSRDDGVNNGANLDGHIPDVEINARSGFSAFRPIQPNRPLITSNQRQQIYSGLSPTLFAGIFATHQTPLIATVIDPVVNVSSTVAGRVDQPVSTPVPVQNQPQSDPAPDSGVTDSIVTPVVAPQVTATQSPVPVIVLPVPPVRRPQSAGAAPVGDVFAGNPPLHRSGFTFTNTHPLATSSDDSDDDSSVFVMSPRKSTRRLKTPSPTRLSPSLSWDSSSDGSISTAVDKPDYINASLRDVLLDRVVNKDTNSLSDYDAVVGLKKLLLSVDTSLLQGYAIRVAHFLKQLRKEYKVMLIDTVVKGWQFVDVIAMLGVCHKDKKRVKDNLRGVLRLARRMYQDDRVVIRKDDLDQCFPVVRLDDNYVPANRTLRRYVALACHKLVGPSVGWFDWYAARIDSTAPDVVTRVNVTSSSLKDNCWITSVEEYVDHYYPFLGFVHSDYVDAAEGNLGHAGDATEFLKKILAAKLHLSEHNFGVVATDEFGLVYGNNHWSFGKSPTAMKVVPKMDNLSQIVSAFDKVRRTVTNSKAPSDPAEKYWDIIMLFREMASRKKCAKLKVKDTTVAPGIAYAKVAYRVAKTHRNDGHTPVELTGVYHEAPQFMSLKKHLLNKVSGFFEKDQRHMNVCKGSLGTCDCLLMKEVQLDDDAMHLVISDIAAKDTDVADNQYVYNREVFVKMLQQAATLPHISYAIKTFVHPDLVLDLLKVGVSFKILRVNGSSVAGTEVYVILGDVCQSYDLLPYEVHLDSVVLEAMFGVSTYCKCSETCGDTRKSRSPVVGSPPHVDAVNTSSICTFDGVPLRDVISAVLFVSELNLTPNIVDDMIPVISNAKYVAYCKRSDATSLINAFSNVSSAKFNVKPNVSIADNYNGVPANVIENFVRNNVMVNRNMVDSDRAVLNALKYAEGYHRPKTEVAAFYVAYGKTSWQSQYEVYTRRVYDQPYISKKTYTASVLLTGHTCDGLCYDSESAIRRWGTLRKPGPYCVQDAPLPLSLERVLGVVGKKIGAKNYNFFKIGVNTVGDFGETEIKQVFVPTKTDFVLAGDKKELSEKLLENNIDLVTANVTERQVYQYPRLPMGVTIPIFKFSRDFSLGVIQSFIDDITPGNSLIDDSFDHIHRAYGDVDIHMRDIVICESSIPKAPADVVDRVVPIIRAGVQNTYGSDTKTLLAAISKRNGCVPVLSNDVPAMTTAVNLVNAFFDFLCVPGAKQKLEEMGPISVTVEGIQSWVDKLETGSKASKILNDLKNHEKNGRISLMDIPADFYSMTVKTSPKVVVSTSHQTTIQQPQTIMSQDPVVTAVLRCVFEQVQDRIEAILKTNVVLPWSRNSVDFEAALNYHMSSRGQIGDLPDMVEMDFSAYDKSQMMPALMFKNLVYAFCGVIPEIMEYWSNGHVWTVGYHFPSKTKASIYCQHKSGDATTLLGNTLYTLALNALAYEDPDMFISAVGDDSLVMHKSKKTMSTIQDVFRDVGNVEVKQINNLSTFYCGHFIVFDWFLHLFCVAKDPVRIAYKFGVKTPRDLEHLYERYKSLCDETRSWRRPGVALALAEAAGERYKTFNCGVLIEAILSLLSSQEEYASCWNFGEIAIKHPKRWLNRLTKAGVDSKDTRGMKKLFDILR